MTKQQKDLIDGSTYRELLRRWRFAPSGNPLFQGECGEYYSKVMFAKRDALGPAMAVAVSKSVGWEG